jgi:hypothetical protein
VAILAQLLVGFGNMVGRGPHWKVEETSHHCNLFLCLVGNTAKGRKGTSWDLSRSLLLPSDEMWARERVKSGLSSGEGLTWAVRDPIMKQQPIKIKGRTTGYEMVQTDPGIADKRLLSLETEFSSVLKVIAREGNTLSALMRQAWDSGDLKTLTKNNPANATAAHITIIGHITTGEARKLVTEMDAANGLANRFLWLCVRRSKELPFGGRPNSAALQAVKDRIFFAAQQAREITLLTRDDSANDYWTELYPKLTEDVPGIIGAILARSEPLVMRLAMIYALLDSSCQISRSHLESAVALWNYCDRSARYVFGESLGDPDCDHLLASLKTSPAGLTQREICHVVFGGHKGKGQIAAVLSTLQITGRAHCVIEGAGLPHRPTRRWFSTSPAT